MIFIFLACSGKEITLRMLWFNFILGLIFISHCFKLIIMHYHTPKQREIKFKPRIKLNHNMYITLPFGLPSAPYIFFFSCGPGGLGSQKTVWRELSPSLSGRFPHPNSQTCQRNVDTSIQQLQDWGIPLHPDKLESPSTILTVLGIELDSLLLQARLPQEKFDCIHTLLVTKTPLHTEGAGVFNWQSSTCMQSRPFWSHLPPPYDQSALTFLQREPSCKA